jgi:glycerophosphoryl diester phosphodiesterase
VREEFRQVASGALRDFRARWRTLIITDLAWRLLALAVLTPLTAVFLRWLLAQTGTRFVADADILWFFVTTVPGLVALTIGGAILISITALEAAALMAVAASENARTSAAPALAFAAMHAGKTLRLVFWMIARVLAGLLPFVVALGLVYLLVLREHDINYYLARRPPAFWVAAALVTVIVTALAALALRTLLRWALALPLVLFEHVHPRHALAASAARSEGRRGLIAAVLGAWAVGAMLLGAILQMVIEATARFVAPSLEGSLALLMGFTTGMALLWALGSTGAAVISAIAFSLLLVRLWRLDAQPAQALPATLSDDTIRLPSSRAIRAGVAAAAVLLAAGLVLVVFVIVRQTRPTPVLAHRGSPLVAPENTLASFSAALAEGADYIELDVQETLDGQVVVVHDSDLMKLARSPMKIWEHTAAELQTVDLGHGQRVPTLAEVLELCRGKSKVMIELKSYGHDQNLEARVAAIVEAAGMESHCEYMSLNHDMVRRMKSHRPQWRVGALAAKSLGDLTAVGADFLAVESRMATARFIRRAHRAGQEVYVWTVNDPSQMLAALSRGADGLITDRPALAREVIERRTAMTDAQRLMVALMLRAGESGEGVLRP